jgi:photosystem II stability/assembly factor-like uncharacterized protein
MMTSPVRGLSPPPEDAPMPSRSARLLLAFVLAAGTLALAPAPSARAAPRPMPSALFARLRWRFVGPYRGGWATTVTGIVGRPNTYYIGTADGGVFVTHDGGRTWDPLFQHEAVASIGAIAVAPSDPRVIYVGTGASGLRSDMSFGDGVYRSTDGGRHWVHVGLDTSQHIAWILVSPNDPNRVLVAVLGHAFGPNRTRGVYLTRNGGRTWTPVLRVNRHVGAIDLAQAPHHPAIVYAALWNARFPFYGHYGVINGPGGGLWVSHDGGVRWTKLPDRGLPRTDLGRIGLAVIPGSDGRGLYALVGARRGGIFVTHDGGTTWTRLDSDPRLWAGAWYFGELFVDPKNPRVVYVCNTALYRSTDGGRRFRSIKGSPSGDDFHTMWIDPRNPRRMIVGADQGASISVDDGRTWSSWYNQPTAQIYHVAVDNRFPYRIYGTQQDSGSIVIPSRSHDGFISNRSWFTTAGGEAGYVLPDPENPDIVYGSSIVGSVTRENLRTHQTVNISPWPVPTYGVPPWRLRYRYPFNTALALSPRNPDVLYVGAQVVFRSTNRGESWRVISPVLTGAPTKPAPCRGPVTLADATGCGYGVIYTIDPSPIRKGEIWVGTTNGRVWLTRDGGRRWRLVTPRGLPRWTRVESISPSPRHPGVAYLAANRHRLDDFRPYVYRTDDYGRRWVPITRGLAAPNYVHVVRVDPLRPGLLFAGTENGIDVSFDRGRLWQPLQLNLPTTSVRDIAFHGRSLVVATHGRGFWVLDDTTPLLEARPSLLHRPLTLLRPAVAYRLRRTLYRGEPFPPETPHAANPPTGAVLFYEIGRVRPGARLTLRIETFRGRVLRTFTSTMRLRPVPKPHFPRLWVERQSRPTALPGLNTFVWDLRTTPPPALHEGYQGPGLYHATPITPRGVLVPPGHYRVVVSYAGVRVSRLLTVRRDPRLTVPRGTLRVQYRFARALARTLGRTTLLVRALDRRLTAHPSATLARRLRARRRLLVRLNGEIAYLYGLVQQADAAPTQPERELFAAIRTRLARLGGTPGR